MSYLKVLLASILFGWLLSWFRVPFWLTLLIAISINAVLLAVGFYPV